MTNNTNPTMTAAEWLAVRDQLKAIIRRGVPSQTKPQTVDSVAEQLIQSDVVDFGRVVARLRAEANASAVSPGRRDLERRPSSKTKQIGVIG